MTFFDEAQYRKLLQNGQSIAGPIDPLPVVKIHMPRLDCVWLLASLDAECQNIAYGLVDYGDGSPHLADINLDELAALRLPLGIKPEQDGEFIGLYPISVYARAARGCGYITEDQDILRQCQTTRRASSLYPT